jgi:glucose/arabinose dehydrogenase
MTMSGIFAQFVALLGGIALRWRRLQGAGAHTPAWGSAPVVPEAKPQGAIPTLKMPTARGWSEGQKPVAAPGLKVNAFATGLKHPRWIHVLPNGDVLIAESNRTGPEYVQLRDASDDAPGPRPWRQRQPHHAVARQ